METIFVRSTLQNFYRSDKFKCFDDANNTNFTTTKMDCKVSRIPI